MRIALIEIGGSHDECLYSQLLFLQHPKHEVHLICSSNLKDQVADFDICDKKFFFDFQSSKWKRFITIYSLWRQLRQQKYDTLIFNTAQGSVLRSLLLLPFAKHIRFIGVMHNANKLYNSKSQQIISKKIKKYFVLNDYVAKIQKDLPHLQISSFYPMFFPKFKAYKINKPQDEIWICIPGQIQQKRRDYQGLIAALDKDKTPKNIRFLLLGRATKQNEGMLVKQMISEKSLNTNFIFWERFIPNEEFHAYLQASDFIMPLVSATNEPAYLTHKISGSFNLAFAYKKHLLMGIEFKEIEDFKENALFYNENNLHEILGGLQNNLTHTRLYQNSKWKQEEQAKKYLSFIG